MKTKKLLFLLPALSLLFVGCLLPVEVILAATGNVGLDVEPVVLKNPLQFDSLQNLIVAILNIFTTLMIPVIIFFIIYAGFKYVTAQGNPGQIEEASKMLTYAIIGGVLILSAVAIAEIIKNTVMTFTAP
jgi:Type IV secretion system pilin